MTVHAAIYLRISKDSAGLGLGIERQREACVAVCEARGWTYTVYPDNDVSAFSGKPRPQYERMLEDIAAGRVQAVVVWDLDRLTRRPIEIEAFIALADRQRLILHSIGGDIDLSTDNGRMYARIKGAVARAEVERKSVRQRAAAEQRARAGLPYQGGRRAFGFKANHVDHEPREAAYVRAMYERFAAGESLTAIAKWLNDENVATSRGTAWDRGTVRGLLLNPRYCGKRAVRRIVDEATGRRSRDYEVVTGGTWDALVDEALWHAVSVRLSDPARTSNQAGSARKYLLTGLAACGRDGCGRLVKVGWRSLSRAPEQTRALLMCPTTHLARAMRPIDDFVRERVVERLRREDAVDLVRPDHAGAGSAVEWADKAKAARGRLAELADDYGSLLMTRAEYLTARSAAVAKAEEAEARLAAAGGDDPVARVLASGLDPAEAWTRMSLDARRVLLSRLYRVTILPMRPGRIPFDPASVRFDPVR